MWFCAMGVVASLHFIPEAEAGRFVARGPRYAVSVRGDGADVAARGERLSLRLVGADGDAEGRGETPQAGRVHVLAGRDPKRWRTGLAAYGRVRFDDVYPGIDVAYYGRDGWVEQDVIVAPGADWRRVSFTLADGNGRLDAGRIEVGEDGALHVRGGTPFRLDRPVAYQEDAGGRHRVAVAYRTDGAQVRFEVGPYDSTRELVIDPVVSYAGLLGGTDADVANAVALGVTGDVYVAGVTDSIDFPATTPSPAAGGTDAFVARYAGNTLVFATYLGGSGDDAATSVAVRPSGEVDLVGTTSSSDFPLSSTALQGTLAGGDDAFTVRLDATGGHLLYGDYLGGPGEEAGAAAAHGGTPDLFVAGHTASAGFPTTPLAVQGGLAGGRDAFVSRLRPVGGIANVHAFLETCPMDDPAINQILSDFDIRRNGVLVTSFACASPVSAIPIAQWTDELVVLQGLRTAYHMDYGQPGLLPWTGTTLYKWLRSKIGGFNIDDAASGPSCCGSFAGKLHVTLPDADDANRDFDRTWRGIADNLALYGHEARHVDGFAHSTCCPAGSNCDNAYDESNLSPHGIQRWLLAHWLSGDVYVGYGCADPATVANVASWHQLGALQKDDSFCSGTPPPVPMPAVPGGPCPRPLAMTLAYSTFFGGKLDDRARALKVEGDNTAVLAGRTTSTNFPVTITAYQSTSGGGTDAFVAKLPTTFTLPPPAPLYSTYFGGSGFDEATALAGIGGEMVIAGRSTSTNLPVTVGAAQTSLSGSSDAFVARLRHQASVLPPLAFSTYLGGSGNEGALGVVRDSGGVIVAGWTSSRDLPVPNAFQSSSGGGTDGFVARIALSGSLTWSSYLGGTGLDEARGVAKRGRYSYVVGRTLSADFPTTMRPFGPTGGTDAFLVRVGEP